MADFLKYSTLHVATGLKAFIATGLRAFIATGLRAYIATGLRAFIATGLKAFIGSGPGAFISVVPLALLVLAPGAVLAQPMKNLMAPEAEFHMARMVYADGGSGRRGRGGFGRGWWAIDYPQAELHFHGGVDRLTNVDMADDSHHIPLSDDALFDHPWLFAQQVGQGQWNPSAEDAARLREYLLKGGFLVIDDFHNNQQWEIMASAMRKVLPNHAIVELGPDKDEVFHVLYDLDALTQIPGERHLYRGRDGTTQAQLEGPQKWAGIYDDKGRMMVAINFNMDMGDAWEHADDPRYPEPMTALAYRFGINYLIYAMTH